VLAVLVMAALLVRLGLAHFQREYLIGRELDQLNARWIWRTFWEAFKGKGTNVPSWLRIRLATAFRALVIPLAITFVMAVVVFVSSFAWTTTQVPRLLPGIDRERITALVREALNSADLIVFGGGLSIGRILSNNIRATALLFLGGLVSFSVLGLAAYVANVALVGGVLAVFGLVGFSPGLVFAAGFLPHGAFEIPALMLVSAAVLRIGAVLVTPQAGKSMGQVLLEQLAEGVAILLGAVWPLLAIAAVVEARITPVLLAAVLR